MADKQAGGEGRDPRPSIELSPYSTSRQPTPDPAAASNLDANAAAGEAVLGGADPQAQANALRRARRTSGVLTLALVICVVTGSWMLYSAEKTLRREARGRNRALAAAETSSLAEQSAVAESQRLARGWNDSAETNHFLGELLSSIVRGEAVDGDTERLEAVLDSAGQQLLTEGVGDELGCADLHSMIGRAYLNLGRLADAERHLSVAAESRTRLRGADDPQTLFTQGHLARTFMGLGRIEDAERLMLATLTSMRRELGEDDLYSLWVQRNLALLYEDNGRREDAAEAFRQLLESQSRALGRSDPETLWTMTNLALLYESQERFEEAESLFVEVRERRMLTLGGEHWDTLASTTNLGLLYVTMERYSDAMKVLEPSLPVLRRMLETQDWPLGSALEGLARAHQGLGDAEAARPLFAEYLALRINRAQAEGADADTLNKAAWALLTIELEDLRDPALALGLAEQACSLEGENWSYVDTLALAQFETGDVAAAVKTQRRAVELLPPHQSPGAIERLARFEAALDD